MKLSCGRTAGIVLLLACTTSLIALAPKDDEQVSSTTFVVLKDDGGKPVRNAAVVLHPVGKRGKQMKTGFELKTDSEGKTHFDGIPYGTLRVQVIAHGFQTYGGDYEINKGDQQITIRLKRPQDQYSVYGNEDSGANPGAATGHSGTTSSTPPDK
jgi:Carboxypeptidase regulatory-like domain